AIRDSFLQFWCWQKKKGQKPRTTFQQYKKKRGSYHIIYLSNKNNMKLTQLIFICFAITIVSAGRVTVRNNNHARIWPFDFFEEIIKAGETVILDTLELGKSSFLEAGASVQIVEDAALDASTIIAGEGSLEIGAGVKLTLSENVN